MAVYSHNVPSKYYSRDDLLFLLTTVLVGVLTVVIFLGILGVPQFTHQQGLNPAPPTSGVKDRTYPLLRYSGSPIGDYVSPHTPLYWRG